MSPRFLLVLAFGVGALLAPGFAGCSTGPFALPTARDASVDALVDAPSEAAARDAYAPIACPAGTAPKDPIEYGVCAIEQAASAAHRSVPVEVKLASDTGSAALLAAAKVTLDPRAESYATLRVSGELRVIGRDAVGVMYGALEIADAIRAGQTPAAPVVAAPAITLRAANLFLTLPADGETSWWFFDASFWSEYLDLMARARLDYLDLHGMYDLDSTLFPNALLWFASSKSFPAVGAPPAQRALDLAMLNRILAMAKVRGIRVGLMSYDSTLDPYAMPAVTAPPAEVQTYTLEAVEDLLAKAPDLAYVGFRVGESGEPASFYQGTFVAGILASKDGAHAATRSWGTNKVDLTPLLAEAGPDTIVEVKMNGEHLGPPYVMSGARMTQWGSYSYQDFLQPPTPYRLVFQVRSGGTHRIFRYASYERTRRTVLSLATSPRAYGFSFEAPHAYYPQRDFYHASPADVFSPWTFRRDELAYLLFGRLGYDASTPASVFRAALAERVGTDGLWDAVQSASDIVPWIMTGNACGPDQRGYAPEMELGGTVAFWAAPFLATPPEWSCSTTKVSTNGHGPFDTFAVALPDDAANDLVVARGTARVSPVDVALTVMADGKAAREASKVAVDPKNAEARDVVRECGVLADLGDWFAHKLRGATALAVYEKTASPAWLTAATNETQASVDAWTTLSADTAYILPFNENMRMTPLGVVPFHWKAEAPRTALDVTSVSDTAAAVMAKPPTFTGTLPDPTAWLATARGPGVGLASLDVSPRDPLAPSWTVTATFAHPVPAGATVGVLARPFQSDAADWASVPATGSGTVFSATVAGTGIGAVFAVAIDGPAGVAHRYPDAMLETPYLAVPP